MARRIFIVLAACICAAGQSPRRFEVASIKPANADGAVASQTYPGGRLIAHNLTLKHLIRWAYDVNGFLISGGPSWVNSQVWDVDAKPERAQDDSRAGALAMLQTLLTERFHLEFHRDTVQTAGYLLAGAKKGPKLQFVREGEMGSNSGFENAPGKIVAHEMPMSRLAKALTNQLGVPVVEQTGLQGVYDFKVEWNPDEATTDSPSPSIFTALREQLGLELRPAKVDVQNFVIDRAERPTAN
jgi:uncharacterized protein (TIGR03435 family)